MIFLFWIKRHLPETFLVLILGFLCYANYTPGTFLTGWDNLMPELNIWSNIQRSLLATWQEYQGLGLVGGMGHAADLVRQLILLPFILVLPSNLIRYLWHFAMLFLGTFGIYFGLKKTFNFPPWTAFCSSIFYLLNFGSIQYFWAPYEAFSTFWGLFPWLIFSLWNYFKKPSKQSLFQLLAFNILAIPSFYVPTLFVVYLICIFLLLFSHFLSSIHTSKFLIHHSLKILIIIFLINSFWLLSFAYFLGDGVQNPRLALGNTMASQETFDRNVRRGYVQDFLLLRGYYYDFPDTHTLLMSPWISHFSNHYYLIAGYLLSIFVIVGLISLIVSYHQNFLKYSVICLFLLSSLVLLSATPPFSFLNTIIRQSGFLDQVFRSPWTKFIVPAIFTFSILTAFGLQAIVDLFSKFKYSLKPVIFITHISFIALLIFFSFPAFQGNYISPNMRQKIPNEYFELFHYFDKITPTARIMNLPQGSFWGWTNYIWHYSGSGFLWYGLRQPILDRAFDVWNLKNENYYFELMLALQQKNIPAFQQILDKYSIEYVVFDNSVYYPNEKIYSKLSLSTKYFLSLIPNLKVVKQTNQLTVYQYSRPTQVYSTDNLNPYLPPPIPQPNQISTTPISASTHSPLQDPQTQLIQSSDNFFRQTTTSPKSNLLAFNFPKVTFDQPYYLKIESRHVSGFPLTISAFDDHSQSKFFFQQLPAETNWTTTWIYLPQIENYPFNSGLTVLFNNPSFNFSPSINDIKDITLFSLPSSSLPTTYSSPNINLIESSSRIFFYQLKVSQPNKYILLPQSYSPAWLAFYFDNYQIKFLDHYQMNHWANGWKLDLPAHQSSSAPAIYILFWPQLLEFLGFSLLIGTFIYILRRH